MKSPEFESTIYPTESEKSQNSYEPQPELSEEDQHIQCNYEKMEVILKKAAEFLGFFDYKHAHKKPGIFILRHQKEFFYPKYQWQEIQDLLSNLTGLLIDLSEDPKIKLHPRNHLDHILGNSPYSKLAIADWHTNKITEKGGELKNKERDLLLAKETMDLLLTYLDFIESNSNVLQAEVEIEAGWIEKFSEFYLSEGSDSTKRMIPEDGRIVLAHTVFFARLKGWKSTNPLVISLDKMNPALTRETFETEFEKLPGKELLDKEKIYHEFIEKI